MYYTFNGTDTILYRTGPDSNFDRAFFGGNGADPKAKVQNAEGQGGDAGLQDADFVPAVAASDSSEYEDGGGPDSYTAACNAGASVEGCTAEPVYVDSGDPALQGADTASDGEGS
ncbi:hypothetical protein GN244_ATG07465 [Phytophthora infestans]|uniref:Uncharacterized protein n=1 Tax=Phytophthora infestans TaxID=4787 RepID=A0A833TCF0_PHYIN|nr:hypothetical protein GN244_ATG07465 [Phytophthora infestans]KAF4131766.1 hypothetical protein GN958_ATG19023 [Phytophthora infestans]